MKFFTNKNVCKKIIIAILLITMFNFISPTISHADFGGALFKPIAQLLTALGDLIIGGLQSYFIGFGSLYGDAIPDTDNTGKTYYIRYSPGIIFSGTVPGLKVNFINASKDDNETYKNIVTQYVNPDTQELKVAKELKGTVHDNKETLESNYGYDENTATTFTTLSNEQWWNVQQTSLYTYTTWVDTRNQGEQGEQDEQGEQVKQPRYIAVQEVKTYTDKDYVYNFSRFFQTSVNAPLTGSLVFLAVQELVKDYSDSNVTMKLYKTQDIFIGETEKKSAALTLKSTIATWYKALRAIALVGLLSVLVYVGIRIMISSTGQEKAKYKKMIGDWVVAICILFILQYIMIFITEIAQDVTNVLNVDIMGSRGEDILMSDLRNAIQDQENTDFSLIFPQLILYVVLVIYTVLFTIQYLKRFIYLAFFTMIAPLIALTYPIDKIKDGQAQAFSMWIREYTFNALLQPMHLLLYYIFVTSAMNMVSENPLYAVIAIGFLLPAEKFFRKMFGFDKASSASQLGAAAGGALVMNAINKMGQKSGKQAAGNGGNAGGSGGSTPRYVKPPNGSSPSGGRNRVAGTLSDNSYERDSAVSYAYNSGTQASNLGSHNNTNRVISSNTNSMGMVNKPKVNKTIIGRTSTLSGANRMNSRSASGGNNNTISSTTGEPLRVANMNAGNVSGGSNGTNYSSAQAGQNVPNLSGSGFAGANTATPIMNNAQQPVATNGNDPSTWNPEIIHSADQPAPRGSLIAGFKNLGGNIINKHNIKNGAKTLGRMTRKVVVGAVGAAALGTAGLAAGVATGDASKALQYGGAGALAGSVVTNKMGDAVVRGGSVAKGIVGEGTFGTEEFNTRKSIKELRNDHDFNKACKELNIKGAEKDKLIRDFHSNGITKSTDIKKALNVRLKNPEVTHAQIVKAQQIRLQSEKYGMKRKEIVQKLVNDIGAENANDSRVRYAMNLIDQL